MLQCLIRPIENCISYFKEINQQDFSEFNVMGNSQFNLTQEVDRILSDELGLFGINYARKVMYTMTLIDTISGNVKLGILCHIKLDSNNNNEITSISATDENKSMHVNFLWRNNNSVH